VRGKPAEQGGERVRGCAGAVAGRGAAGGTGRAGSPRLGDTLVHSSGLGVAAQSGVMFVNHFFFVEHALIPHRRGAPPCLRLPAPAWLCSALP